VDRVARLLQPVGKRGVAAQFVGAAQRTFVAGGDVVVLVDRGQPLEQHKQIAVPPVAEAGRRARAKLLLNAGQPSLGALPRVVRAIKIVAPYGRSLAASRTSVVPALVFSQLSLASALLL